MQFLMNHHCLVIDCLLFPFGYLLGFLLGIGFPFGRASPASASARCQGAEPPATACALAWPRAFAKPPKVVSSSAKREPNSPKGNPTGTQMGIKNNNKPKQS